MKSKFLSLYQNNRELTVLQIVYLAGAIITVFICGLLALVNQELGMSCLFVPLVGIAIFCTNIVVWSLTKFIIDSLHPELKEASAKSEPKNSTKSQSSKK